MAYSLDNKNKKIKTTSIFYEMCLIIFSFKESSSTNTPFPGSLMLVANRDEYYERPTKSMHWWGGKNSILAGKDLMAGGTWLGISADGRFGAITNYKEITNQKNLNSRGELISNFLSLRGLPAKEFIKDINVNKYAGFNLLLGDRTGIHYFSNRSPQVGPIKFGTHVIGNLLLNSETNKSLKAKVGFKELKESGPTEKDYLRFMKEDIGDLSRLDDEAFKRNEHEEIPYRFIKSRVYGTRCTTILTIDQKGNYKAIEQTYAEGGKIMEKSSFEFSTVN